MKRKSADLLDEFLSKEVKHSKLRFRLIKYQDGTYHIKRGFSTLVVLQEEAMARKGFKSLRDRWATGEQGRQ